MSNMLMTGCVKIVEEKAISETIELTNEQSKMVEQCLNELIILDTVWQFPINKQDIPKDFKIEDNSDTVLIEGMQVSSGILYYKGINCGLVYMARKGEEVLIVGYSPIEDEVQLYVDDCNITTMNAVEFEEIFGVKAPNETAIYKGKSSDKCMLVYYDRIRDKVSVIFLVSSRFLR